MRFTRLHPRCGTNYLFLVMAISILFFAALPYSENFFLRFATRVIFLPLVAGLSYEVLKLAAASDALPARIARAPGLALQYLTTREPDEQMLEVALAAFHLAMDPDSRSGGGASQQPETPAAAEGVAGDRETRDEPAEKADAGDAAERPSGDSPA